MSIVTEDTDRWLVSARADGEVLTTLARVPGLELWLLGRAEGYAAAELGGWLRSLAQAVRDSVSATPPGDPVPPMLREAMSGLLFSRAELWNRGLAPCAIALVGGTDRIGFGWVGEAAVEVFLDGARTGAEWVSIRDAQGREARAWCGSPSHDVRIELSWTSSEGPDALRLEAHWTAARSHEPAADSDPAAQWAGIPDAFESAAIAVESRAPIEPAVSTEPDGSPSEPPPASTPTDAPSSGVARWLSQHLGWNRHETGDPSIETPTVSETQGMPMAPPVEEQPAPTGAVPVEDMVEGLAVEISDTLEPPTPDFEAIRPAAEIAHDPEQLEWLDMPAEVPEQIPPTPESEDVTARALTPPLFAPADVVAPAIVPSTPEPAEISAADSSVTPPAVELEREAEPEPEPAARRAPPRQPEWPEATPAEGAAGRSWKLPALWGGLVLLLFGVGWVVGSFQGQSGPEQVRRPSALLLFLRQIGLAPPRFEVAVTSRPEGAWIAVDGKELSVRAPVTLELPPGEHRVELSFPELGNAPYLVRGGKNDRVALDAPMWGSVDVVATEARALVNVALDGEPMGFVPLHVDSVAPGPHELRFSGPGMASWGSTIEVRVGEVREVLAYPLQSPATGLLQVRATQNTEGEAAPLDGARVWVDGAARGVTPLTLELARGPHSVRVSHQREETPVQVIDLPGGNQRFATFEFGLRSDLPALTLKAPAAFTVEEPALISATLSEVATADVREMWLHVRTPESRWRRYPMTLMDAQGSVVGAAPFPIALLGEDGQQLYYVSAITTQGDEVFTEMQTARGPARARP